jgi:predicted MPP superfamily phosphohydrolase
LKFSDLIPILVFLTFSVLLILVQRFWFLGAWHWIATVTQPAVRILLQIAWFAALFLFAATFLDSAAGRVLSRTEVGKWIIAAARIWLLASLFAFLLVKLVGAVGWGFARVSFSRSASMDPARRNFFRYAAYLAGGLPFVAATYGFAAGRLKFRVERVEVPISDLPKGLDGLKIVQLSDIHIGEFMPREQVRRAVEIANSLGADLAVITGDFISGRYDPLEDCIAELSQLRAPLGRWGCNGNHEIYAQAEDAAHELFRRYGMTLLRQENVELQWRGEAFNLIGVDYQRDRMTRGPHGAMLSGVENLMRSDLTNILLSHNPNSFHRAAELGIELSLAGHTHGGQVKVEIVDHSINPARLITDFVAGLYHLPMNGGVNGKKASLYVNRGLGTFGMPVRLGVPPEITLLALRSA